MHGILQHRLTDMQAMGAHAEPAGLDVTFIKFVSLFVLIDLVAGAG